MDADIVEPKEIAEGPGITYRIVVELVPVDILFEVRDLVRRK